MEFRDYYATLGVDRTASDDEIRKAYRKLARQYHPDLNPGDQASEARFKEINEAHEVLGKKENRKKYDELGANWRQQTPPDGAGGARPGGGWSAHFGGEGGRSRPMSAEEMHDLFGQGDPFSDFFHTFFGGGGGAAAGAARGPRARRRPTPGRDVEQPVELTLEEAFHGTSRKLRLSADGADETIDVRIPAGVKDGARVRAAGKGLPSTSGGPAGDLYLRVRLLPHPSFERRGNDLHTRLPLPIATAVLGGEATVRTLDGADVRLKVPETTPAGRVFRLRGRGMPVVGKDDERGDLYAAADLRLPATLSPEARRHYEALQALDQDGTTRSERP
jgi:DnaJ-class molecular chaperone